VSASGAAPTPVLALVPPGPSPSRPGPGELSPEGRRRMVLARRYATAGCVTAAVLPVFCAAAAPYVDDVIVLGFVLSWLFLLPGCGLALLLAAALGRTHDDLRALVMVALALVLGVALIGPASRVGMEAFVSSHAAELDAAAAEQVASHLPLVGAPILETSYLTDGTSNGRALRELGLRRSTPVRGGLRFEADAPFAPSLFYADARLDQARSTCVRESFRPIGGRWFLYECHARSGSSD